VAQVGPPALCHAEQVASRLHDADWGVRAAAANALGKIGKAAGPYAAELIALLGDINPTVRAAVLSALPKLGGDVARLHWQKVVHSLENDESDMVRNTAFEVIREMCKQKPGAEREEEERRNAHRIR